MRLPRHFIKLCAELTRSLTGLHPKCADADPEFGVTHSKAPEESKLMTDFYVRYAQPCS